MRRSRRNLVVAVLLVLGLAAGLALVLTGGDEESATTTTSAVTTTAPEVDPLPLEDTSQAALEELTGLVVPAEATGFLTARLDDDRQLDMTFVMPAASLPPRKGWRGASDRRSVGSQCRH